MIYSYSPNAQIASLILGISCLLAPLAILDAQETKTELATDADIERWTKDFHRRDKDHDGQLTLTEHVGPRTDVQRLTARDAFFRWDRDEDEHLSLDEYLRRATGTEISVRSRFRQLDGDDDSKLSEEEFMRTKRGTQWEQAGLDNFRKFDLDADGLLNEREFAMTPALKPDPATMFRGLDVDQNGSLSNSEFLALVPDQQRPAAHRQFYLRDQNDDDVLDLSEYRLSKDELPDKPSNPFKTLDADDDGQLTFAEYDSRKQPETNDEVALQRYEAVAMRKEERFIAADRDHDGHLTAAEFAQIENAVADVDDVEYEPGGTGAIAASVEARQGTVDPLLIAFVAADGLLVLAIAFWWVRTKHRRTANS